MSYARDITDDYYDDDEQRQHDVVTLKNLPDGRPRLWLKADSENGWRRALGKANFRNG